MNKVTIGIAGLLCGLLIAGLFQSKQLGEKPLSDPVKSNNDLLLTLEKYKSGDQVNVKVKRKDQSTTLTVTLGSSY